LFRPKTEIASIGLRKKDEEGKRSLELRRAAWGLMRTQKGTFFPGNRGSGPIGKKLALGGLKKRFSIGHGFQREKIR